MPRKRFWYRVGADVIWVVHFLGVALVLFGWLLPSLWLVYMAVLVGTLASLLTLTYCPLSKWEFDLRKKINPDLDYDYGFTSYYTHKLTGKWLSDRFLARAGLVFIPLSLGINLYFRYFFA